MASSGTSKPKLSSTPAIAIVMIREIVTKLIVDFSHAEQQIAEAHVSSSSLSKQNSIRPPLPVRRSSETCVPKLLAQARFEIACSSAERLRGRWTRRFFGRAARSLRSRGARVLVRRRPFVYGRSLRQSSATASPVPERREQRAAVAGRSAPPVGEHAL